MSSVKLDFHSNKIWMEQQPSCVVRVQKILYVIHCGKTVVLQIRNKSQPLFLVFCCNKIFEPIRIYDINWKTSKLAHLFQNKENGNVSDYLEKFFKQILLFCFCTNFIGVEIQLKLITSKNKVNLQSLSTKNWQNSIPFIKSYISINGWYILSTIDWHSNQQLIKSINHWLKFIDVFIVCYCIWQFLVESEYIIYITCVYNI